MISVDDFLCNVETIAWWNAGGVRVFKGIGSQVTVFLGSQVTGDFRVTSDLFLGSQVTMDPKICHIDARKNAR